MGDSNIYHWVTPSSPCETRCKRRKLTGFTPLVALSSASRPAGVLATPRPPPAPTPRKGVEMTGAGGGAAVVRTTLGGAAVNACREPVKVDALVGMGAPRESFAVSHARAEGEPEAPGRVHQEKQGAQDQLEVLPL